MRFKHVLPALLFTLHFLASPFSFAGDGFLDSFKFQNANVDESLVAGRSIVFVEPNELNMELVRPYLQKAQTGAIITVGTERAFIEAAITPNADHLIILDAEPSVIRYNKANTELLRLSKNRADYLKLRLEATYEECLSRIEAAETSTESFSHLKVKENFTSFIGHARSKSRVYQDFNRPAAASDLAPFRNVNYLHDDELFKRVQKMAKLGNIKSYYFNFMNKQGSANLEGFSELTAALEAEEVRISVLDLSNTHYEAYIGPKNTNAIASFFYDQKKVVNPGALFAVSDHHNHTREYANGEVVKSTPLLRSTAWEISNNYYASYAWEYHVYDFSTLAKNTLSGFSASLPSRLPKTTSFNDVETYSCNYGLTYNFLRLINVTH